MKKAKVKYIVLITVTGLLVIFLANSLITEVSRQLCETKAGGELHRFWRYAGIKQGGNKIFSFLSLCVLIPIAEEFVFRFGFFNALKKYLDARIAALVSSVAFALAHGDWVKTLTAFFVGLLFCYIYEKSADIRFTVAIHILNNISAYCSLFNYEWKIPEKGVYSTAMIYMVIFFAIWLAMYVLRRSLHKHMENQ